ncbi:hypothetical protein CgunFtcFv8_026084 [Champsocephalus gunnari]|uniref:Uncharacterized protein n=1 Tax=Champsocephalus gunnari TaxID=52237 RepID=A0AAN8H373_CHAGU|nr:hypothetical protein CgunFtcFv8_026084 [Champsocephalus gunnari]
MAGVTRKGSGRPSYYYRFLGKSRLQRQRSRSRSRTRPSTSRESPPERSGRRRSMPGSSSDKNPPTMEATSTAATPFRVTPSSALSVIKRPPQQQNTTLGCL